MDLLASLGLGNALPEQSTRLTSHPGIIQALESSGDTDDGIQLGFNACLRCGSTFNNNNNSDGKVDSKLKQVVSCKGCKRVKYCSTSCRKADATAEDNTTTLQYEDEPAAIGHSPVICALLNLCNDDEDAEEEFIQHQNYVGNNSNKKKKKSSNNNSSSNAKQDAKKEAATYRIQTEFESYPATLFNILSEGPNWYIESITRRLRSNEMDVRSPEPPRKKQRRGKRDKSSLSPCKDVDEEGGKSEKRRRELVLHIVGASVDSELWHWEGNHQTKTSSAEDDALPVVNAYAEAASNLASHIQNLLEIPALSIRCIFIGPDCPKKNPQNKVLEVTIPDLKGCTLVMETHRCNYGDSEMKQKELGAPDAIVFFNPGFSCPDYDWSKALATASSTSSTSSGIPFLITTNTEMEGFADVKCLLDGGYVTPTSVPGDVLEAVDHPSATSNSNQQEEEDGCTFFFGENPYSGMRVRQSGTMGNDLYVKNRWIVGGLFQQQQQGEGTTLSSLLSLPGTKTKRKVEEESDEDEDNGESKKKRKKSGGGGSKKNTKRKNPALI